jgi:hypothetical protein
MPVTVWTSSRDVPGIVCEDARLTDRSRRSWPWQDRPITTVDQIYGQAGWDVGVNFLDIGDLLTKLTTLMLPAYVAGASRRIRRGEIRRLAIHAHGVSGTIFINGQRAATSLSASTVGSLHTELHGIGLMTPDDAQNPAVILFPGCLAGQGADGTALLIALSRVWPNRRVVAFATLGYAPGGDMSRTGAHCTEPGMRDTTALFPGEADRNAGRYWGNLRDWPWASETSPRAKVAINERLIAGSEW